MLLTIDHQDMLNEAKVIKTRLIWEPSKNHEDEHRVCFAKVESSMSDDIYFTARVNKAGEKHFILQESKKDGRVIRRWGNEKGHVNPDTGKSFDGPHKHYWTDEYGDGLAYRPNPPISLESVEKGMLDFLKECNITLEDGYDPYPGFREQRFLVYTFEHLSYGNKNITAEQVIESDGENYHG